MVAIGVITPFMVPIKVTMLIAFVIRAAGRALSDLGLCCAGTVCARKRSALTLVVPVRSCSYQALTTSVFGQVFGFHPPVPA